jgi:hypothetical protein
MRLVLACSLRENAASVPSTTPERSRLCSCRKLRILGSVLCEGGVPEEPRSSQDDSDRNDRRWCRNLGQFSTVSPCNRLLESRVKMSIDSKKKKARAVMMNLGTACFRFQTRAAKRGTCHHAQFPPRSRILLNRWSSGSCCFFLMTPTQRAQHKQRAPCLSPTIACRAKEASFRYGGIGRPDPRSDSNRPVPFEEFFRRLLL